MKSLNIGSIAARSRLPPDNWRGYKSVRQIRSANPFSKAIPKTLLDSRRNDRGEGSGPRVHIRGAPNRARGGRRG